MLRLSFLNRSIASRIASLREQGILSFDAAQDRAVIALTQLTDKLQHGNLKFGCPLIVSSEYFIGQKNSVRNDRLLKEARNVEDYTRRLAKENAELLFKKQGKKTPLSFFPIADHNIDQFQQPDKVQTVQQAPIPKNSIYLFGSVGRGKTMLMDLFMKELSLKNHKRVHFFDFMQNLHKDMILKTSEANQPALDMIANRMADDIDVLFLDEVAVSDIQDAVVFPRVLTILLRRGVSVIMTSNSHPINLYSGGLNRHLYIPPLITALQEGCRLVDLGDTHDYRKEMVKESSHGIYFNDRVAMERTWNEIKGISTNFQVPISSSRFMPVSIKRTESINGISVNFETLCKEARSEADFIALADFSLAENSPLFVFGVPLFDCDDLVGIARRFGRFVEICYDKDVRVRIGGCVPAEQLYNKVFGQKKMLTLEEAERLGMTIAAEGTLNEALSAAERAQSRLIEWQSAS